MAEHPGRGKKFPFRSRLKMKGGNEIEYWNSLVAQIIAGQQEELKAVMLEMMGDWAAKEIKFEDLTIAEIIGWLIDNQDEINYAGLIK